MGCFKRVEEVVALSYDDEGCKYPIKPSDLFKTNAVSYQHRFSSH